MDLWSIEARPSQPLAHLRREAAEPHENKSSNARHGDLDGDAEPDDVMLEDPGGGLADDCTLRDLHGHEGRNLHQGQAQRERRWTIFRPEPAMRRPLPDVAKEDRPEGGETEEKGCFDCEDPVAMAALPKDLAAQVGVWNRQQVSQPVAQHGTGHSHAGNGEAPESGTDVHLLGQDTVGEFGGPAEGKWRSAPKSPLEPSETGTWAVSSARRGLSISKRAVIGSVLLIAILAALVAVTSLARRPVLGAPLVRLSGQTAPRAEPAPRAVRPSQEDCLSSTALIDYAPDASGKATPRAAVRSYWPGAQELRVRIAAAGHAVVEEFKGTSQLAEYQVFRMEKGWLVVQADSYGPCESSAKR